MSMTTLILDGQTVEITGDVDAPTIAPGVSDQIPVAAIRPNPQQPRQEFDPAKLQELANSIKEHGVIQPIVVEIQDTPEEAYILHDGERRWRATQLAGLETIPAYVLAPGTDPKALLLRAVVANVQRTDLTPIELAQSYQKMKDDFGMSDADIAQAVGQSRSSVANTRRLLQLPQERQDQVNAGDLSERQAAALLPFYRLTAAVQEKITNDWRGRRLAQPSALTSDQIRQEIKAGIASISREITAWQPKDSLSGISVHQPRCADCDYYLKSDNQHLCLDRSCFEKKKDVVTNRQLQEAAEQASLPVLRNGRNSFAFRSDNVPPLEHALETRCKNLHIDGDNYANIYCRPDGCANNIRYVCAKSESRCECNQAVHANDAKRKQARKAECQHIKDKTITALSESLTVINLPMLKVLASHILNSKEAEQAAGMDDPGKIGAKIARRILDYQYLPDDPEQLRRQISAWLAPIGFVVEDAAIEQAYALQNDLKRIQDWSRRLHWGTTEDAKAKAITGNLTNLAKLAEAAADLKNENARKLLSDSKFFTALDTLKTALLTIRDQVAVDRVENTCRRLITDDRDDLERALTLTAQPDTITYALALLPLYPEQDTMERRQAMLRRARVLGQVNDITLQLGELSAWLDANRSGGTKQKLLNRSAKCGDLVYDANQLDLSEEQKKALVADIEAVEARYSHAIRNPGGVCTPTHKEAHDDQ